ncbi:metallophosphoesterase, partial [Georgenia sp. 10Sc9-8]|nr:metallophosphoesterase [Georgenia halotolerans]
MNHRAGARAVAGGLAMTLAGSVLAVASPITGPAAAAQEKVFSTEPVGTLDLLTDPFLQMPGAESVHVVWNTEFAGPSVALVGDGVDALGVEELAAASRGEVPDGITAVTAESHQYSRLVEDVSSHLPAEKKPTDGIADRTVWRHEAAVTGLEPGVRTPYRVVSVDGDGELAASGTFTLAPAPRPGDDLRVLLTSDHQAMANTPANLQVAADTIGDIDAVFLAGDLVNHPDRASEWFDDTRGGAFFPVLQGNAARASTNGDTYQGAEIIQHAPLYPAVGNHEVQGRVDGMTSISSSFGSPVPVAVAEAEYEKVADEVNPTGDPAVRDQWIEDNSFSTTTYEEMFTLPDDSPGGETYYATTVGDVRLISLFSTRIWRGTTADADPGERTSTSRYQESVSVLGDPLAQGYGEHIFEPIGAGSEQFAWLQEELASEEFQDARFRVVMLHEGPQGLGDNVMPHFADPVRIEETDDAGNVVGVRYEYPAEGNVLVNDLQPMLEEAGVDLVHNGHSHLWNRFRSEAGTNYLETSNTGNSYGAYHELSGRSRPVPPEPWDAENYVAQGNPGGLDPIMPTGTPLTGEDGEPVPFVQSNDHAVFAVLDTGTNEVISYHYDVRTPDQPAIELDRFSLGRAPGEEPGEPTGPGRAEHGFFLNDGWDAWANHVFQYGRFSDEVLIGNWDKSGIDTITMRRGNEFHVSNAQRGGDAEEVFRYGRPGDPILVGDWDGDGLDTLAVRRGNEYHVKNAASGGDADVVIHYGRAGD